MPNYDFSLDMATDNSNSLILRNIKPGSKVLEMGSAHGRMTKYLAEELKCEVSIVELNREAGKIAAAYAKDYWIGSDVGNIESLHWFHDLNQANVKFDHIIFADVLEHLHEPRKVLEAAAKLLTSDGSIFISIPNVSHNALVIDLLQDKFEYRDAGILDKTHLKFFAYNSLKQFVADCGLTVVKENNAINVVKNTEFSNSYAQLPTEVSTWLQKRKYGEVYQFIWELKSSCIETSICIPVFGKWNFTKACLDDLLKLDPSKHEIIVVDNASADETSVKMAEYTAQHSNIVYLKSDTNEGFAHACNKSYSVARGNHILFLNNDIRVKSEHDSWTNHLIEACTDNNLVGPTGGKVDEKNGFQFLYETNDPNKSINYMSGWCLCARKTVWNKLLIDDKLWDEDYFAYYEDVNLSMRSSSLGIKFCLVNIPVVHFGKVTSKQLNTYALYKQSKEIFIKKWKHLL